LGGDAGVIGAGEPEGVIADHAMPADGDVDLGVLEHVADVEHAGDVGRGDYEREDAAGIVGGGAEDAGVNPPLRPMRFEALGLVNFLDLHGKDHDIRGGQGSDWVREMRFNAETQRAQRSAQRRRRKAEKLRDTSGLRMGGSGSLRRPGLR
jgi:hypothetical protein